MDDRVDAVAVDGRRDKVRVTHVADDERQRPDRSSMSVPQVVEDDRGVAGVGQVPRGEGADIAGAPGDQDSHREDRMRCG